LIERYHWFIGSFPELVALLVLYLLNNCLFQDNVFIISNFKSKYPVLQLDLR
jgi:predicted tellurium resistance membrane protein TerC